eukprot:SAG22_NODE_6290_length_874_cov_1.530323_1_plen_140_part_00
MGSGPRGSKTAQAAPAAESGQVELRIDPADGLAYTEADFIAQYGDNSSEWKSAALAQVDPAGQQQFDQPVPLPGPAAGPAPFPPPPERARTKPNSKMLTTTDATSSVRLVLLAGAGWRACQCGGEVGVGSGKGGNYKIV